MSTPLETLAARLASIETRLGRTPSLPATPPRTEREFLELVMRQLSAIESAIAPDPKTRVLARMRALGV